ncbi:MAG: glycosyltransferase [Sulfitobacter sp.]
MHIVHLMTRMLRGGSEENTLETCRWQVAAGHRVTVLHGAGLDPYWESHMPPGVERVALPQMVHALRPFEDMRAVAALRRAFRMLQPDVIHTHQSKAGILGRLAARAAPGAVVAHGIHIVPFEGVRPAQRALFIAAERLAARRTDVFIGVSEAVGRSYVSAGIARRGRVHCVRSGMDLARFRDAKLPRDWRQLLDVPRGGKRPKVALMMAAFEPRKGHLGFLRGFAQVAAELPDLKILLAGAGPEEGRVRAEVAQLGLGARVVFCGHRPDPEALFALADFSVLTSAREGLPRVAVQSIAAGCPVVLQDLPGIDEVIRHGENGLIVPPGNMQAVMAQMAALLRDETLLSRLRAGALASDLQAWELEALGARTTALYGLPPRQEAPRAYALEPA